MNDYLEYLPDYKEVHSSASDKQSEESSSKGEVLKNNNITLETKQHVV